MPEVLELFMELAAIPSPPGEERAVADVVASYLRDCAVDVDEDDAGAKIGATAGNLYARLEPTVEGRPIFLCAHLDTVPPTGRIEPVVDDEGVVRNAAGTILGADDKAAVAAMLEATAALSSAPRIVPAALRTTPSSSTTGSMRPVGGTVSRCAQRKIGVPGAVASMRV